MHPVVGNNVFWQAKMTDDVPPINMHASIVILTIAYTSTQLVK